MNKQNVIVFNNNDWSNDTVAIAITIIMAFKRKENNGLNNEGLIKAKTQVKIQSAMVTVQRGRTPPLNEINLPGEYPAVGINNFEGTGPKWLRCEESSCYFLPLSYPLESGILRGRGKKRFIGACLLSSQVIFHLFPFFFFFL